MLNVISLGAGVQSTTMALMAKHGFITPMPDCAIFADTGDEPFAVYRHLDWLEGELPFPVYRVKRPGKSLSEHVIDTVANQTTRTASPPFFTAGPDGMLPRQCSTEFKVRPIDRKIRQLLGKVKLDGTVLVQRWIGISVDEIIRTRPSRQKYAENRYPLIEQRMSRAQCQGWLIGMGFPAAPKSACVYCPYHDAAGWRRIKKTPEDWFRAVAFDAAIRSGPRGLKGTMFVHPDRVPLDQVDLTTLEDHGQLNMFNHECEGMCGV